MSRKHVVVVGTGGSGLAAAASAAIAGASVTVLESQPKIGGTTAISGGAIWLPATKWQAAKGVQDTREEGVAYLDAGGVGDYDPGVSRAYVAEGHGVLEAIEEHTVLRWHHMTGFPDYHSELPGGKPEGRGLEVAAVEVPAAVKALIREDPYDVPPMRIGEAGAGGPDDDEMASRVARGMIARGPGLIGGLAAAALERGAEIRTETRARELLIEGDAVVGVRLEGGEELRGPVILGSGGFERNETLVKQFIRGPLMAPAGPPGNRGDGLLMSMAAGAALGNMSEAWWAPAMEWLGDQIDGERFFRIMFTDCAHPGGILVDAYGRRFVNEATNYSDLGRGFHEFDASSMEFPAAPAWLVFDETRRLERGFVGDTVWTITPGDEQKPAGDGVEPPPTWMKSAETLAGLAEQIDVPADRLQATVERFNRDALSGVDKDFGRGSFIYDRFSHGGAPLRGVTDGPFHAIRALPGALGTKGGPRTDGMGRVLRQGSGKPIPGLYASGNAAANPFGLAYPGPGATVGPGVVFGWLAARDAAGL